MMTCKDPSRVLTEVIERARQAQADRVCPPAELKRAFIAALEGLIHDALTPAVQSDSVALKSGSTQKRSPMAAVDPAFQALVLTHCSPQVAEFVSLSVTIRQDRQQVVKAVNAVAHPGKLRHMPQGWKRHALARIHRALPAAPGQPRGPMARSSDLPMAEPGSGNASPTVLSWSEFADTLRAVLAMPEINFMPMLERHLADMLNSAALQRSQRFDALATHPDVHHYLTLQDQQGPRAGSATAAIHGSASRRRGQAVEDEAAEVFRALVAQLNHQRVMMSGKMALRVVTALKVPSVIAGGSSHSKTEWDVVVLRQRATDPETWDLRLLVEVKASADAAVTDFPRLLRGIELLAGADAAKVYTFETAQGRIKIRGASLAALSTDDAALKKTVRYWCDTPSTWGEQVLNPANRMRLLSAPACVEFASTLIQGGHPDPARLEAVWDELLVSSRLRPVLDYQPLVQRVQGLMIRQHDMQADAWAALTER